MNNGDKDKASENKRHINLITNAKGLGYLVMNISAFVNYNNVFFHTAIMILGLVLIQSRTSHSPIFLSVLPLSHVHYSDPAHVQEMSVFNKIMLLGSNLKSQHPVR